MFNTYLWHKRTHKIQSSKIMRYYYIVFKYTQCFFSLVYHAELYSGLMLFDVYISIFIYYISVVPYLCEGTCFLDVAIRAPPISNILGESLFPFPGGTFTSGQLFVYFRGLCNGFPHAYHVFRWRCDFMFDQSGLISRGWRSYNGNFT